MKTKFSIGAGTFPEGRGMSLSRENWFCRKKKHHPCEKEESQARYLHLLLNDAFYDKKAVLRQPTNEVDTHKQQLPQHTTWLKYRLICFSINRLLSLEKKKITRRHQRKLGVLLELKRTSEGIMDNPNETIVNLTNHILSPDELDVLKLGLRYGLATRPNKFEIMAVAEDVWSQVSCLNAFKDGKHVQDKIKNSLRSVTYDYIDLDLKEFKYPA